MSLPLLEFSLTKNLHVNFMPLTSSLLAALLRPTVNRYYLNRSLGSGLCPNSGPDVSTMPVTSITTTEYPRTTADPSGVLDNMSSHTHLPFIRKLSTLLLLKCNAVTFNVPAAVRPSGLMSITVCLKLI